MGFRESLKHLIYKTDMLSTSPSLRIRSSQNLETLFGGVLSLIIIAALSVIFFQSLISVLRKIDISYQQTFQDDPTSAVDITSFQFAVGIEGQDLSASLKQFQINLVQVSYQRLNGSLKLSTSLIELSLCNVSDWKNQGTQFQNQFYGLGMDKMYCLSPNKSVSLYGYDGSLPYRFLTLRIKMCNSSIPNCDSAAHVQSMMAAYLAANSLFRVRLFVANTLVSPSKNNPISKAIEKNLLLSFTSTTATVGYIYMGDYTVATDQSIFLVTQNSYLTGSYIDTSTTTTIPYSGTSGSLITFNFYKSTKRLTISRSYGKIDDLLSYIGGLFSLVLSVVSFFFASYSSYCYELAVAQACFSLDQNGTKYREKHFNFLTYIKYSLFDWLSYFGVHCDWQQMHQIAQIKDEVQSQIDISIILRRIRHLQTISKILMNEHKYLCLYLATPPTLDESKRMKQAISFYDELLLRLEESKEDPAMSKKKVANQTQLNIIQDGVSRQRASKQLFYNEDNDKAFVQALAKLKEDLDCDKFRQLILKKITESVPNDSAARKTDSEVSGIQYEQF